MLISRRLSIGALGLAAALVLPFTSLTAQTVVQPGSATAQAATPDTAHGLPVVSELKALKYRSIGPVAGRPRDARRRRARRSAHLLRRHRRRAASGSPPTAASPGSRSSTTSRPRTIGSIAVAPSDPNVVYVGIRRGEHPRQRRAGQRHLQVDRRRQDLDARLDAGRADRHDGRPPDRIPTSRSRRCSATRSGRTPSAASTARATAARRGSRCCARTPTPARRDVALRPVQPERRLRRAVAGAAAPVGADERRPRQRPVRVARRRRHVEGSSTRAKGLPDGVWGKVGVAVAPSDGRRVYALIEAEKGGLFRSDDGGDSWTRVIGGPQGAAAAPGTTRRMTVNPTNADDVWFPQVPMLRTHRRRQARSRSSRGFRHGDHHDLWIDPKNPRRMIDGNDGGVEHLDRRRRNVDGRAAADRRSSTTSSADNRVPYRVAGAMQDLGTAQGPSNSLRRGGIRLATGTTSAAARPATSSRSPTSPTSSTPASTSATSRATTTARGRPGTSSVYPENGSGHGAEDLKYRFQWTAPIADFAARPKRRLPRRPTCCSARRDGGQTWTADQPAT